MTIQTTQHNENYWVFIFDTGAKCSVGVYDENENPNGALTEEDAIKNLQLNFEDLEI